VRPTLIALALAVTACGGGERDDAASDANSPEVARSRGPDLLVLRVPRKGGIPQVHAFPQLDSVVWRANERAPVLARVLAFDEYEGSIAAVDERGVPVRIDLRLGGVTRDPRPAIKNVVSADGYAIYGLAAKGDVVRLTPGSGEAWTHKPRLPVREVLPQPNGSLVLVADSGQRTVLWQMQPPETRVARSLVLERTERALRTPVGDRVYLTSGDRLLAVRIRDLESVPDVELPAPPRALVTSPSGDRVYVIADSSRQLFIIDRYSESLVDGPELPGYPRELRMDPTGRYLLIRAAASDTVWVLSVGTDRLQGSVVSDWRTDLPTVAPDGRIVLARGDDVVFVSGELREDQTTIKGGANDLWYFFNWDGFRPRLAETEAEPVVEPVVAETPDDTIDKLIENPFAGQLAATDTAPTPPEQTSLFDPPAVPEPTPLAAEYTLQFGALRHQDAAMQLVREIREGSSTPRVMATVRVLATTVGESAVHRVVAGPFRSRADAESAGRQSAKPYWVYEGAP
jgi:DNA-binding beta-propeller fold protein YncE